MPHVVQYVEGVTQERPAQFAERRRVESSVTASSPVPLRSPSAAETCAHSAARSSGGSSAGSDLMTRTLSGKVTGTARGLNRELHITDHRGVAGQREEPVVVTVV